MCQPLCQHSTTFSHTTLMIVRERIAKDVYVFTSREYAQVTAGAILTKEGAILIDTLFYPEETLEIKHFLEERLGLRVRYVINTHYHADHSQGTYLFPLARVVSHASCRALLDTTGRKGLAKTQAERRGFEEVRIILPTTTFNEAYHDLFLGSRHVRLLHMPGHSPDLTGVFLLKERILFASDNLMMLPTLFDGTYESLVSTLERIQTMSPDYIVQGHGEVLLRGGIPRAIKNDLAYLATIKEAVDNAIASGQDQSALADISVESCGKRRTLLEGVADELHLANLQRLYELQVNG